MNKLGVEYKCNIRFTYQEYNSRKLNMGFLNVASASKNVSRHEATEFVKEFYENPLNRKGNKENIDINSIVVRAIFVN